MAVKNKMFMIYSQVTKHGYITMILKQSDSQQYGALKMNRHQQNVAEHEAHRKLLPRFSAKRDILLPEVLEDQKTVIGMVRDSLCPKSIVSLV